MPVVTCLTVQDTSNVYGADAIDASLIRKQLECIAGDAPIHAIKTGALGNAAIVDVLVDFAKQRPDIPLITDPVIKAAGGGDLADDELISAMKDRLFPLTEVITPNGIELCMLGDHKNGAQAANNLLNTGCTSVLATGGHGTGTHIVNTLYSRASEPLQWEIERMGGEYHGTGCTLAAAISAGRASGLAQQEAIAQAQNYVRHAIMNALEVGKGQPVPNRGVQWQP